MDAGGGEEGRDVCAEIPRGRRRRRANDEHVVHELDVHVARHRRRAADAPGAPQRRPLAPTRNLAVQRGEDEQRARSVRMQEAVVVGPDGELREVAHGDVGAAVVASLCGVARRHVGEEGEVGRGRALALHEPRAGAGHGLLHAHRPHREVAAPGQRGAVDVPVAIGRHRLLRQVGGPGHVVAGRLAEERAGRVGLREEPALSAARLVQAAVGHALHGPAVRVARDRRGEQVRQRDGDGQKNHQPHVLGPGGAQSERDGGHGPLAHGQEGVDLVEAERLCRQEGPDGRLGQCVGAVGQRRQADRVERRHDTLHCSQRVLHAGHERDDGAVDRPVGTLEVLSAQPGGKGYDGRITQNAGA